MHLIVCGMFFKWRVSIWGIPIHPFIIAYIGDKQVKRTVEGVGETLQGSGKQGIKDKTSCVWNIHIVWLQSVEEKKMALEKSKSLEMEVATTKNKLSHSEGIVYFVYPVPDSLIVINIPTLKTFFFNVQLVAFVWLPRATLVIFISYLLISTKFLRLVWLSTPFLLMHCTGCVLNA